MSILVLRRDVRREWKWMVEMETKDEGEVLKKESFVVLEMTKMLLAGNIKDEESIVNYIVNPTRGQEVLKPQKEKG